MPERNFSSTRHDAASLSTSKLGGHFNFFAFKHSISINLVSSTMCPTNKSQLCSVGLTSNTLSVIGEEAFAQHRYNTKKDLLIVNLVFL